MAEQIGSVAGTLGTLVTLIATADPKSEMMPTYIDAMRTTMRASPNRTTRLGAEALTDAEIIQHCRTIEEAYNAMAPRDGQHKNEV